MILFEPWQESVSEDGVNRFQCEGENTPVLPLPLPGHLGNDSMNLPIQGQLPPLPVHLGNNTPLLPTLPVHIGNNTPVLLPLPVHLGNNTPVNIALDEFWSLKHFYHIEISLYFSLQLSTNNLSSFHQSSIYHSLIVQSLTWVHIFWTFLRVFPWSQVSGKYIYKIIFFPSNSRHLSMPRDSIVLG